jgi:hypothetical protein
VRADRDRPIQWFFEDVPRTALDEALLTSGDERFHRLHDALHDDVYRRTSPGTLCRRFGVSWIDLVNLWFSYNIHLGLLQLANHLPKILNDIAEDSESRDVLVRRATGWVTWRPTASNTHASNAMVQARFACQEMSMPVACCSSSCD